MIFWEDIISERPRIENAIKKYGYAPEHNFEWYQSQPEKGDKNVFVEFEDGSGLMTLEDNYKKTCSVFSSPIAPPERRSEILIEYLNKIFDLKSFPKIEFELEEDLYRKFIKELPAIFKSRKPKCTLSWPIYDLSLFDENLSGRKWSSLRKSRNKFYKEHLVKVLDAKSYKNKDNIHNLIDEWGKNRHAKDRAYPREYHFIIDKNFSATTEARLFSVDEKICGINAGWMIPNTNRYYGAIGIHNYAFPGLGDALYLEDLIYLKSQGYKETDMGGGEKELNAFKAKSHPQSFYKTYNFTIIKI